MLDGVQIKKLKLGELIGRIATVLCGVALVYFIVLFAIAQSLDLSGLRLAAVISAPSVMALSAAVSAYCNLKFTVKLDKIVYAHVNEALVSGASLLHPEKTSLSFTVTVDGSGAEVAVNNYKEKIEIDFSAFGKLSAVRRSQIFNAIASNLSDAYIRMYERGVKLTEVSYRSAGSKKEKSAFIIEGGAPDKRAYRAYLKSK